MNQNKIFLKGLIVENEEKLRGLEIKIENYSKDVAFHISTLAGIDNINIETADVIFKELKKAFEEYKKTKEELKKLKEEING